MAKPGARKVKSQEFFSTIELDGILNTSIRAKLVIEFLKDILYQRQQIPMQHDQIIKCLHNEQKKRDRALSGHRVRMGQALELRKTKAYIENMREIILTLEHVFAMASSIKQVLVSLGSTIVTPRETYHLHFPTTIHGGKILSLKHCKTAFFKQLIASPFFVDIQAPKSCTKVQILLEMLEGSNYDLPIIHRPTYKPSKRGKHLELHFVCNSREVSGDLSRQNETAFDMSGVEPLNHSVLIPDVLLHQRISSISADDLNMSVSPESITHSTPFCPDLRPRNSSRRSDCAMDTSVTTPIRSMSPMLTSDHVPDHGTNMDCYSTDTMEYTWYQLDTCIQGYRDKTTKTTS